MGILDRKTVVTNQTDQFDMRVVGGDGSINTSSHIGVSGTGNVVSTTDHGAVAGSLQLALRGVEGANQLARDTQAATGGLLDGALKMVGEQQQQHSQALENIKSSDMRVLIVGALAVVAVVVARVFKKG